MRRLLFTFLALATVCGVHAETRDTPPADYQGAIAERPKLLKGDRWEYMRHGRALSYEFVEEKEGQLLFEKLEDGTKTTEFYTPDLNFVKELNEKGDTEEEVKPYRGSLGFPLWVGRKWSYTYSTTRGEKRGMPGVLADFAADVEVVSYEQVTVPAGTFWAFKIEEARRKKGERLRVGKHRTVWYSPEVKRVVKTEEENEAYNRELIKYSPGDEG